MKSENVNLPKAPPNGLYVAEAAWITGPAEMTLLINDSAGLHWTLAVTPPNVVGHPDFREWLKTQIFRAPGDDGAVMTPWHPADERWREVVETLNVKCLPCPVPNRLRVKVEDDAVVVLRTG